MPGIMNILGARRSMVLMTRRYTALALAVLLPLAAACSDNDPTGPASHGIVGRWQITSFQVGGMELVEPGSSVEITFTPAGTYSVTMTGDFSEACGIASTCTETGTYASTSTRITLDPGSEDELVLSYSIQGRTMTFTGEVEGMAVKMVLQRL